MVAVGGADLPLWPARWADAGARETETEIGAETRGRPQQADEPRLPWQDSLTWVAKAAIGRRQDTGDRKSVV